MIKKRLFLSMFICILFTCGAFAAVSNPDFIVDDDDYDYSDDDAGFMIVCSLGSLQDVKNAINSGGNVNAVYDGVTPLISAAMANDNPKVITALVNAGADVNLRGKYRETPLIYAAMLNFNPEVTRALVEAGADVNAKNDEGMTSLMAAARENFNPKVITTLLELGADPKEKDNSSKMAIDYARENVKLKNTYALKKLEEAI
ncbi:MAG: ankyrin repeat domain-containing protein [Synergistaceae bacterium]|nr:ankyrin repeat domain-containing protein [Synergistaceae bacterium]